MLKRARSERTYVAPKIKYPEKLSRADWAVPYNPNQAECFLVSFNRYPGHVSKMSKSGMDWSRVCERFSTCCTMVVNSRQSCTMLFFSNEYSVTLENGDLEETEQIWTLLIKSSSVQKSVLLSLPVEPCEQVLSCADQIHHWSQEIVG